MTTDRAADVPQVENPADQFAAVESTLGEYNSLVVKRMAKTFPETTSSEVWDLARDYPSRPGKGLRPSLMIATCRAFGGSRDAVLGPATALELLHNAFLIHDDVEDASTHRRGERTLHELHDVPRAINAGDALGFVALLPLRDRSAMSSRIHRRVLDEFEHMARLTVEGQARELEWRDANGVTPTPEDYLDLIMHKTCWYTTILPLRVGAIVGSRGRVSLEAMNRFGFFLGAAFQIRDDLLNLVAWSDAYGKERLGDIREGKRTLMLIHLMDKVVGDDAAFLQEFLGRSARERSSREVDRVFAMMIEYGSMEFAEEYGKGIAVSALGAFDEAFADVGESVHRSFVRSLVPYMLARRH